MNRLELAVGALLDLAACGWDKQLVAVFEGYSLTSCEAHTTNEAATAALNNQPSGLLFNPALPHHLFYLSMDRLCHVSAHGTRAAAEAAAASAGVVLLLAGPSPTAPIYLKYFG